VSVKYCDKCGNECIETMRVCPQCGNSNFSDTAPTIISQSPPPQISDTATDQPVEATLKPVTRSPASSTATTTPPQKLVGIRGWLLFFVISLIFIGPIILAATLAPEIGLLGTLPSSDEKNIAVFIICVAAILGLASIFIGVQIWQVKINAIRYAKIYLIASVIINLGAAILLYNTLGEAIGPKELIIDFFRTLIGCGIWYAYLSFSKRVKNTFG
jgi:hypothetical protein